MRLGIFGGSFDPIHYGHLILAEQCREQAELDRVLFVPANQSPLKSRSPVVSDKHRLEMLSLAVAGHSGFEISTIELDRGGKSFTIDTLLELKTQHADAQLFLLMGEDSVQSFDQWKEPAGICEMATPLVCRRPSTDSEIERDGKQELDLTKLAEFVSDSALEQIKQLAIQSRLIEISSTDVRTRIGSSKSVRYLLPRAVEKYLQTQKLYQQET